MSSSVITQQVQGLATATSPGLVGTGAQTFAGKKTLDGGALIKADSAGTTIPAGYVGYQVRGFTGSGSWVSVTNATWADVASITLTVGTWDITSFCLFHQLTALTGTRCLSGIGTVAGNSSTGLIEGDNRAEMPLMPNGNSDVIITIPNWRVIITSGTQTYYMKAYAAFSSGTMTAFGRLTAVLMG